MSGDDQATAAGIVAQWYWQAEEGHNRKWKYAPKTFTRFYESAPLESDVLKLVIEYLRTQENISSIDVFGKTLSLGDLTWRATDAWFQTQPGDKMAGTESTRVRIYQKLIAFETAQSGTGAEPDGPHDVENDCQYAVEHTFYWDVEELPVLPASSSGVQYSIQGVVRDRETGLLSCTVEKRTRIEQSIGEHTTSKTQFEEIKTSQWIGVKTDCVSARGSEAGVSDGTIVERIIEKNPDCTSTVTNRKKIEQEVEDAKKTVRKTLRAKVTETVHVALGAAKKAQKVPQNIPDGGSVVEEKTPGKRTNVTVVVTEANEGVNRVSSAKEISCGSTTLTDVESMSNSCAERTSGSAVTVEANKVKRVTFRKNEDGVTTDREQSTTCFHQLESIAGTQFGQNGTNVTVTKKVNSAEQACIYGCDIGVNKVVEVDNVPNDHGSFTTTKRITCYKYQCSTGGAKSCVQCTVTQHFANKASQCSAPTSSCANKVVEVDNVPNDHGSFSVTKRTTKFFRKAATAGTQFGSAGTNVTVTRTINSSTAASLTGRGNNKVVETENVPNDHGGFTTTVRVTCYKCQSSCGGTMSSERRTTARNYVNKASGCSVPSSGTPNKVVEVENIRNDHGTFSVAKRTTCYFSAVSAARTQFGQDGTNVTVTRQVNNCVQVCVCSGDIGANKVVEVDNVPNDHGSFTTTKRITCYKKIRTTCGGGSRSLGHHTATTHIINTICEVSLPNAAPNMVVEIDNVPNDHGSFNSMHRVTCYYKQTATSCSQFGGTRSVSVTRTVNDTQQAAICAGDLGTNKVVETDNVPNDHGSFTTTKRITRYEFQCSTGGARSATHHTEILHHRNTCQQETPPGSVTANKVVEVDNVPNDIGGYNSTRRTTCYYTASGSSRTQFGSSGTNVTVTRAINDPFPVTSISGASDNKVIEVENAPNEHGSYTTMVRTTCFHEQTACACWCDDEWRYSQKSYQNATCVRKPSGSGPFGHLQISVRKNDHGSYDGGYLLRSPRMCSSGLKFIEQGKAVWYSVNQVSGDWSYTNGTTTIHYYKVFEYRRFCTMRIRWVGLTKEQATSKVSALASSYTRTVYASKWNNDGGPSNGTFTLQTVGQVLMAKIYLFQISSDVYGVRLEVYESTSRLSLSYENAENEFSTHEGRWEYDE